MALLYIDSSQGILELTVTTDIKISSPSAITRHKMESSQNATDNVVNENKDISISGMVSEIKRIDFTPQTDVTIDQTVTRNYEDNEAKGNQKSVKDNVELLYKIRDSKEVFTVYYDDRLDPLDNCLFSNITLERDSKLGTAYGVSVSISQIRFSTKAVETEIKKQSNPDNTSGKSGGSNTSTEKVTPDSTGALGIIEFATG